MLCMATSMRVQLSKDTLDSLENVSNEKISRNADEIIQKVCDIASGNCNHKGKAWLESEIEKGEKKDESS